MSRKQTSQQSSCDHVSKVLEWGFDSNINWTVTLWGCVNCDATSTKKFDSLEVFVDHSNCKVDPCFGCKAKGLQFATGDANSKVIESNTTQKKWDSELAAYRQARKDGIQPAGTSKKQVEEAYKASETIGKAYDANTMPKTKDINKNSAEALKHVGMV